MDRRLSRSPAFKSPVLSPKTPAIYEKYKSGCASGLIRFFDFRQAPRSKFISDKKHVYRQAKVDNKNAVVKTRRSPARGCDATEAYRQPSNHRTVEKSSNNNLACVVEASEHQTEINVRVEMNEAVEAFVTDGGNLSRNDFIDALEVLNSNKELFMKLLQDPNSLLVKHIQDLRDVRATKKQPRSSSKAKTSRCQPKGAEECNMPRPSTGKQNCPDKLSNWPSPQSRYNLRNKAKSVRPLFLSFEHMKKKLRHAMRVNKKEHRQMPLHDFKEFKDNDKETSRQASESISTSKSYQDIESKARSSTDDCESNALDFTLQPNAVQNTNTTQRTESINLLEGSECFECSKPNSPLGDTTSCSSIDVYASSPYIQGAEISDSMSDGEEQPSPISVLEQFFDVEENTSSPSNVSQSCAAVLPSEQYATSFLESKLGQKNNYADTSDHKQTSLFECIREVLQVSGFNSDDLSRKWLLSDQFIDTTLFDNVEVFPEKSGTDRRLFFAYISEVLLEIHQCNFRCSPWISILESEDMVHDVLRHVDWQLLSELPQQPLQQLVENDLRKCRTWMDIRLDTQDIVTELVDSILEDLVLDAAVKNEVSKYRVVSDTSKLS